MAVIRDRNSHTGIIVAQGPKYVTCVLMASGELTTTRLTQDEYDARGFRVLDYPLDRAARQFLNHTGGISDAARRAIERVTMFDLLG